MKKILLCLSLVFTTTAFSQVLDENFENLGGALPPGWLSTSTTPGAGDWKTGNAALANTGGFWPVPATSDFAQISDDVCNCNLSAAYLRTPSMNLTGLADVIITYDFVDDLTYGGLPHLVEVSTDGSTWTTIYTYAAVGANINWQTNTVALGAATNGDASVWVRFKYNDNGAWATGLAIDNVVVQQPAQNDARLLGVTLERWSLINTNNTLAVEVENVGANPITSLTIDWSDGASHSQVIPVNILPGATETVNHPISVNYSTAVEENISVIISLTNGTIDGDPSNNALAGVLHNTLSQATNKAVVFETGGGTWNQFTPRAFVAMDSMIVLHPDDYVGIMVHNNDPMTVVDYDAAVGFSSFPAVSVDRSLIEVAVSFDLFEEYYNERVNMGVPANISAFSSGAGTIIDIEVNANFYTPVSNADYRLSVVIKENGVTGTTSDYDQQNYYAGGGNGPMGGFENFPSPVPAANMIYNNVGRALLGGYDGQVGSVVGPINDGTVANYVFSYNIPSTSNRANMYGVAMLIDNATGEILNASQFSIAVDAGIETKNTINMNVFPNPASEEVTVAFDAAGDYTITITDMAGRVVSTNAYSNLSGAQSIAVPVAQLMSGNYLISVATEGASHSEVLVIR